jgi:hypothetical protein
MTGGTDGGGPPAPRRGSPVLAALARAAPAAFMGPTQLAQGAGAPGLAGPEIRLLQAHRARWTAPFRRSRPHPSADRRATTTHRTGKHLDIQ